MRYFSAISIGAALMGAIFFFANKAGAEPATSANADEPGESGELASEPQLVSFADSGWATVNESVAPAQDGLLVDLADEMDAEDVAELGRELGLEFEHDWDVYAGNRYTLRGTPSALVAATKVLEAHPDIDSVEANVFFSFVRGPNPVGDFEPNDEADTDPARPAKPNDPMYKNQWHMDMINAEGAWARTAGQGVIVAVIDTGVSPGKLQNGKKSRFPRVPDLKETVLVPGYDFVGNRKDPSDGNGHGTHVAGTIAQSTHNNFGVAGVAYKAKIMPIKVLSDRGWGSVGAIASGIRFAADNGASVINMSLGGGGYSASMAKAIKYAHDKGVIVVCAAGNGGRERVEFPAAYPEAFAVSALGPDGKLAFYSSYGKELAIAAPGGDTRVDLNKDGIPDGVLQDTIARGDPTRHGFFPFQGTSMATPHVAGVAALVVSAGVTDPDRVAEILMKSAKDMNDPIRFGAGGLDAAAAVKKAQSDKSLLSLGLAALFAIGFARRNRRRDALATFRPSLGFVSALVMGASGLFFLHGLGVGSVVGLSFLAEPIASWPAVAFGAGGGMNPFWASAFLAVVPMALFFGVKRLRGALAGFAIGLGSFLLARAFLGSVNVSWIPGHGMLDMAWLVGNGALALLLGRIAMMRD